jgi:hypothetical protein
VQAGQGGGVGRDGVGQPCRGGVPAAADEQGGLGDGGAVEVGEVFPVPVHVAVPGQRSAHAGPLELPGVHVEVVLAEPGGRPAGGEAVAEGSAGADEVRVGCPGRRHGVGGQGGVEAGEPAAHVGFDLGLRATRLLEVGDVELLVAAHSREDLTRPGPAARRVGDAEQPHRAEDVRPDQGGVGGDGRAPVVADDHRRPLAQRVHHCGVVLDEVEHSVRGHVPGPGRASVTAHVDGDGAETCGGQGRQLVAPGVPGLRETVHQQDQGPGALLDQVNPTGRRGDQPVRDGRRRVRHESSGVLKWRRPDAPGPPLDGSTARRLTVRSCVVRRRRPQVVAVVAIRLTDTGGGTTIRLVFVPAQRVRAAGPGPRRREATFDATCSISLEDHGTRLAGLRRQRHRMGTSTS